MPQAQDENATEKPDLQEYWALARRRYWHFLIPMFLGWLAVFALSWLLPTIYRSGTLILVEQPRVPQQYVVPVVTSDLQQRLASVTQQILSRTRLEGITNRLNLYSDERAHKTPDDLVERMRKDIDIELVRSTGDKEVTAFNVYYSSRDPRLAQRVTSELTRLFITENLETRREQAEQTTQFLQSQLDDARNSLAQQEERLRKYKDQYLGELPGQLQSNMQILSGLQSQLQAEQDALGRARQQNTYLQSLLSQYATLQTSVNTGNANGPIGLPAVDQELERLRAQLADLTSHYTDRHPDVRKVKEQIANAERIKQKIKDDLAAKASGAQPSGDASASAADYGDSRETAAVLEVRSQLQANQLEIANRQKALKDLEGKIAEYQSRLNRTPVREQQLADITRDYDQSRSNYESLLAKKNQSELATALEKEQQGETFRVVDPPSLPTKPYSPDRFKMVCLGFFVGLVLGVGSAGMAEFADDRVYKQSEIKKLVRADMLIELPPVLSTKDEDTQRRMRWLAVSMGSAAFVVMMAGTVFNYLKH
jgi:polysaccharide chain length determinant protein (PEP-CTERM system associated)